MDEALASYQDALKIFRDIGAKVEIERTERNIADVKAEMEKRKN